MPGLEVTYNEFVNEIMMSNHPYILLEGSDDKSFFDKLLAAVIGSPGYQDASLSTVAIETAERVKSDGPKEGNRQKVENVSRLVSGTLFRERFVGFVDREFRKFRVGNMIADCLGTQQTLDRLVWSRGHSIENYLFDFQVFRVPLQDSSLNGEIAETALEWLEKKFQEILGVACALGFAGKEMNMLDVVRGTVHFDPIMAPNSLVLWDVEVWKKGIIQHSRLNAQQSDALATRFEHWLDIVKASDPSDIKWACDGHTGIRLIWEAYAQYVFSASQSSPGVGPTAANQRAAITGIPLPLRFNHLARSWATLTAYPAPNTPFVCFDLIKPGN